MAAGRPESVCLLSRAINDTHVTAHPKTTFEWKSRASLQRLREAVERRRSIDDIMDDTGLRPWERAILGKSIPFIRRAIARPDDHRTLDHRLRNLARTLDELRRQSTRLNAERYERSQRRFRGNRSHLERLLSSLDAPDQRNDWNRWRHGHPRVTPDLTRIDLTGMDLRHVDLRHARLAGAALGGASLRASNLSGADLRGCTVPEADASYATLRDVDLRDSVARSTLFVEADLRGADLRNAKLISCNLNKAQLQGSKLSGALVWGCSAWDIERDARTQEHGLNIGWEFLDPIDASLYPRSHSAYVQFKVDRIEAAHLLAMIRSEPERIADVLETASRHIVLLLGRFTGAQRNTLEALRRALPEHRLAPMVFDFAPPPGRDLVETVATLAGLCSFIIADLSQPRSTPLEAQLVIPNLAVPYVPIIRKGEKPFAMFASLQRKYPWVLPTVVYSSEQDLVKRLRAQIIKPAQRKLAWLRATKASAR